MNGQKFAVATLAGTVSFFVLGFLIYGLALSSFMSAHMMPATMRDSPDWVHLVLGNAASGMLLTVAIGVWAKTGGMSAGLRIGAQLGFLMAASFDLTMFATSRIMTDFVAIPVDVLASTVMTAVAGAVVGMTIGQR
jgi:uncharacterized membrane protein